MYIEIDQAKIEEIKKLHGTLSGREIARKFGVSQTTVYRILTGKYGLKAEKIRDNNIYFNEKQYENWIV